MKEIQHKIERGIYLASQIKDSPVLRRKIKQRTEWLKTLISELEGIKFYVNNYDN